MIEALFADVRASRRCSMAGCIPLCWPIRAHPDLVALGSAFFGYRMPLPPR